MQQFMQMIIADGGGGGEKIALRDHTGYMPSVSCFDAKIKIASGLSFTSCSIWNSGLELIIQALIPSDSFDQHSRFHSEAKVLRSIEAGSDWGSLCIETNMPLSIVPRVLFL